MAAKNCTMVRGTSTSTSTCTACKLFGLRSTFEHNTQNSSRFLDRKHKKKRKKINTRTCRLFATMMRIKQKRAEAAAAAAAAEAAVAAGGGEVDAATTTTSTTTTTTTAEDSSAMEVDTTTTSATVAATATTTTTTSTTTQKVSLLGIGGKKKQTAGDSTNSTNKVPVKKRTPGELRIQKDIAELDGGTVATIKFPNVNDLSNFDVTIQPDSGYWKNATYHFTFTIPSHYPHSPPKVECTTKIYHPNIDLQGKVCLNILREDWKPVLDINSVIYGLIYLFYEPNPDDPLNHEAAELFRRNVTEFERLVNRTLRGGYMDGTTFEKLI